MFLGNLPVWVTKDDIKSWLNAENLVYDDVKVIRNPETQESKGFAFIDTPNSEEMNLIIRRFDRAPLEDRSIQRGDHADANRNNFRPVALPPKNFGSARRPNSHCCFRTKRPVVSPRQPFPRERALPHDGQYTRMK